MVYRYLRLIQVKSSKLLRILRSSQLSDSLSAQFQNCSHFWLMGEDNLASFVFYHLRFGLNMIIRSKKYPNLHNLAKITWPTIKGLLSPSGAPSTKPLRRNTLPVTGTTCPSWSSHHRCFLTPHYAIAVTSFHKKNLHDWLLARAFWETRMAWQEKFLNYL